MGIDKVYHLIIENCPAESELVDKFLRGVEDEGEFLRAKEVEVLDKEKGLVKVILKEGKKRQLHRMFAQVGARVLDLQRVQIGKLKLIDLQIEEGGFKVVTEEEVFGR
jgi:pseudouridine synthase